MCKKANGIYYNSKLKKCWKNYPVVYYILGQSEVQATPNPIIVNELVEKCEHFYYKDTDNIKHYTDNCSNEGKFFSNGNTNCEDDCTKFGKYYFDTNNKECLDTCTGRPGICW